MAALLGEREGAEWAAWCEADKAAQQDAAQQSAGSATARVSG